MKKQTKEQRLHPCDLPTEELMINKQINILEKKIKSLETHRNWITFFIYSFSLFMTYVWIKWEMYLFIIIIWIIVIGQEIISWRIRRR